MNSAELATILESHTDWLNNLPHGKRADLSKANLAKADLVGASLAKANLAKADLFAANLFAANLSEANLSEANLSKANLTGANLTGANLTKAHLFAANLAGAHLSAANLDRAYLFAANLDRADLGKQHILQIGPIGSRKAYLVYRYGRTGKSTPIDEVAAGCWRGSLSAFAAAVEETHGENQYGEEYRAVIAMLQTLRARAHP